MGRTNPESPVRARGSPTKRSPSRREKSPARHRASNSDKLTTRARSPIRARSPKRARSSISPRSPAREKQSRVERPSKQRKSPSLSPVRHKTSSRARSPPPRSPIREKQSSRARSPKKVNRRSSVSRSPENGKSRSLSPRSKRLKRAQAERGNEREHDRNHGRKDEHNRARDSEKGFEGRDDRKLRKDLGHNGSSRSTHERSVSPRDRRHKEQKRSRSPDVDRRARDEVNSRDEQQNGDEDSLAKMKAAEETLEAKQKQNPSFELSGKLAEETNRFRGVTLLFNEPADARKPDIRWRLYVFKNGEPLNEPLYVHRQSCYLLGRERRVADIPTDHPSCSKQHAVLQYRQVEEEDADGMMSKKVRPYLMDLGSTNGTFLNDNQLEPQRYYELFEKDTIKFGNSSREYVLLHENSNA